MVSGSAHLVVLVVTLSRAELDVGVVGKALSEIGLAVLAAALVGIRAAVRIQPRVAAEVARVDAVVEVAVDAAACVIGSPVVLAAHVHRVAEEVRNALAREGQSPDPGVVRVGVVETVGRVLPLLLRQRRAGACGDGLAGIFGSLLVGFSIVLCRTALQVGTGLHTVDERQADGVLVRRREGREQLLGRVKVGEDDRVVDVVHLGAGVVLGLGFGCRGQDDGHAESQQVVCLGYRILLELVQAYQIEVEHGPVGVGKAQVGTLRGIESREIRCVDQVDHVVGHHDPRIVVVPGEGSYGVICTECVVRAPLSEPVVADVARYDQVSGHRFRSDVDSREREVPGSALLCIARRTGLYEGGRDTADLRLEGHLILRSYIRGCGFFDAAVEQ